MECTNEIPSSAYKLSAFTAVLLDHVNREHPELALKVKPVLAELDR
jgi:hypothetical protein